MGGISKIHRCRGATVEEMTRTPQPGESWLRGKERGRTERVTMGAA